ncbi:MAG: UMP kinase [Eubacteriales bacterium]|jgi:uridylate kinase|nr:UMP kinase [Eubacteriales bacterium]
MYHRVLLKISGEALSSEQSVICRETVLDTVAKIKSIRKKDVQIGIVVGGGNIMRGRSAEGMERNRADHIGMLATAINSLALQDALEAAGVPCVVQSAVDMDRFCDPYSARSAKRALEEGKVVIFACGSGCPFFSTDTAAALRAAEIGADALLLAKNIDAIYSADPKTDPEAVRYSRISYDRVMAETLRATDLTAITLCKEQKIPIRAFALSQIEQIFEDDSIGTHIVEQE